MTALAYQLRGSTTYRALGVVRRCRKPYTATDIARKIHAAPPTVASVLKKACDKGLISRFMSTSDFRNVPVWRYMR